MTTLEVGLIVAAFSVAMAGILAYLVRQSAHMQDMRDEITVLKTQVSPLWAQVQSRIALDLHHPHPRYFEMDTLLEKLESLTITPDERERLDLLLHQRSTDMSPDISEIQRTEAKAMTQVMRIVVLEAKGLMGALFAWFVGLAHHWR
jgi:hypothetical protein